MAKDKDKSRKFDLEKGSKRQFNLDKGTKHSFNLEKDEKNKFNLSKDDNEETAVNIPQPKPQEPAASDTGRQGGTGDMPVNGGETVNENPNSGKRKWIIIALVVIVVAIIAWLLFGKGKSGDVTGNEPATEQTEQQGPAAVTDTTATDSTGEAAPAAADATSAQKDEPAPDNQSGGEEPLQTSSSTSGDATAGETTPSTQAGNTPDLPATLDEQARMVIRGDFGNGEERKQKLGSSYDAIQKRVNEMYKEGLVM